MNRMSYIVDPIEIQDFVFEIVILVWNSDKFEIENVFGVENKILNEDNYFESNRIEFEFEFEFDFDFDFDFEMN